MSESTPSESLLEQILRETICDLRKRDMDAKTLKKLESWVANANKSLKGLEEALAPSEGADDEASTA